MKIVFKIALILFAVPSAGTLAEASVTSPTQSEVPACLAACPAGDLIDQFTLRDFARNPRAGVEVRLDFCDCADFHLVPGGYPTYDTDASGCAIVSISDQQGVVRFPIQGAGSCGDFPISIFEWGGTQPRRSIASVDQNDDLIVDSRDLDLVEAKLGTSDWTADFDCDGTVSSSDVALVNAHMGHGAPTTAVLPGWNSGGLSFALPPSPNPSLGTVTFSIVNPREQNVELAIFDIGGRRLATLWSGKLSSGETKFRWDGRERSGARAAPGLCVVRLRGSQGVAARLFALLR
jgi:hypothetical protein